MEELLRSRSQTEVWHTCADRDVTSATNTNELCVFKTNMPLAITACNYMHHSRNSAACIYWSTLSAASVDVKVILQNNKAKTMVMQLS